MYARRRDSKSRKLSNPFRNSAYGTLLLATQSLHGKSLTRNHNIRTILLVPLAKTDKLFSSSLFVFTSPRSHGGFSETMLVFIHRHKSHLVYEEATMTHDWGAYLNSSAASFSSLWFRWRRQDTVMEWFCFSSRATYGFRFSGGSSEGGVCVCG